MEGNFLANCEAILNIGANLIELIGLRCAGAFIFASLLMAFALSEKRIAGRYLTYGLGSLAFGLATPGCINFIVGMARHVDQAILAGVIVSLGVVLAVVLSVGAIAVLFLPCVVSNRRGKKNVGLINVFTGLGLFIPIFWSIALLLAYKPDKGIVRIQRTDSVAEA